MFCMLTVPGKDAQGRGARSSAPERRIPEEGGTHRVGLGLDKVEVHHLFVLVNQTV